MYLVFVALGLLLPSTALAAVQSLSCAFFTTANCDPMAGSTVPMNLIVALGNLGIAVAASLSVMFVVVGGFLMMIGAGDESRVGQGKKSIFFALAGLALALISQTIVGFMTAQFSGLNMNSDPIFSFIRLAVRAMVFTFNTIFVVMIIVAGFRMLFSQGKSEQFEKAKSSLGWAIAGAIIINVAYALVQGVLYLGI